MSGIGTVATALAVPTNVSTETNVLTIPFSTGNAANPSLANVPGVGSPSKNKISGHINMVTGAGTTAVVVRCRQGAATVTGTVVGASETETDAAGTILSIPYDFTDTASGFAQAYTITVTQTGGTGAGTVNVIKGYVTDYS